MCGINVNDLRYHLVGGVCHVLQERKETKRQFTTKSATGCSEGVPSKTSCSPPGSLFRDVYSCLGLINCHNTSQHIQTLERRINELQEENENLRKALHLPPSSHPPLGRGPTGQNQPEHDAEESRCQTVSPRRSESAGSPSSDPSSAELGHSLIAPSMSSHAMTTDVGPPHQTMVVNEHYTALSQKHPIRGRILPPLHSPPIAIHSQRTSYSSTLEGFIECNSDTRKPLRRETRNEFQHNFSGLSPNYPICDQYQHIAASMHPQPYHDANLSHREWDAHPLPSNRVHTLRNQGFPESRQFPRPPSPELAHPSRPVQQPGYNPQGLSRPQPDR